MSALIPKRRRVGRPRTSTDPLSTTRRGYGNTHQRERKRWAKLVAAGGVACARCGQPIHPAEPWHLDHADGAGSHVYDVWLGASHAACNLSKKPPVRNRTGGQHGQQTRPAALAFFEF